MCKRKIPRLSFYLKCHLSEAYSDAGVQCRCGVELRVRLKESTGSFEDKVRAVVQFLTLTQNCK